MWPNSGVTENDWRRLVETSPNLTNALRSVCYCGLALPELTDQGELPPGVHSARWREFQARFRGSSPRRVWLSGRLRTLLDLAATNGKLRRIFIWGSSVTAKPAPKDLDILLVMDEDFEIDEVGAPPRKPGCQPAMPAFGGPSSRLRASIRKNAGKVPASAVSTFFVRSPRLAATIHLESSIT